MEAALASWPRQRPRELQSHAWVGGRMRLIRTGDPGAWEEIVRRFDGMLRAVVRRHRLSGADAADIVQTTWLRLAENHDRLRDPSRVGAWLATTARRECLRTLRGLARELPDEQAHDVPDRDLARIDQRLLLADRDRELWSALARLPKRDQMLLRMLIAEPQPSYQEIAGVLGMPVGSIGPTRGRALGRLRRELERSDGLDDLAA
jgi:RNA polymerase sigma factor (sigma-70 family)